MTETLAAEIRAGEAAAADLRERLWLYDTTLRDGQQTRVVDFSVEDKIRIAQALDALGNLFDQGRVRHRGALGSGKPGDCRVRETGAPERRGVDPYNHPRWCSRAVTLTAAVQREAGGQPITVIGT